MPISADSLALSGEQIRSVNENNLSTSVEHGRADKICLTMLNNIDCKFSTRHPKYFKF